MFDCFMVLDLSIGRGYFLTWFQRLCNCSCTLKISSLKFAIKQSDISVTDCGDNTYFLSADSRKQPIILAYRYFSIRKCYGNISSSPFKFEKLKGRLTSNLESRPIAAVEKELLGRSLTFSP